MRKLLALAGIAVLWAIPTAAHHSFAAEFDEHQPVTLRGKLTQLDWVNPHGWLHIDVMDPDSKVVNWSIEAGAPNALLRRGLRKTDFPIGVEVIVKGFRAKSGKAVANASSVTLANGRGFYTGADDGPGETK